MEILKNSEKYTVFKLYKKKKFYILKVSNRSPNKIFREINHIKKLKKESNFFSKRIPPITSFGRINRGINKNKGYYEMLFIKGPTLSDIFQKNILDVKKRIKLFDNLTVCLIKEIRGSTIRKKKNAFKLFKKLIDSEYKKLNHKPIFKNLLTRKKILVNNITYLNIFECLKKILKSQKIKNLIKDYNFICYNNHWNFHGGNIIFPKNKLKDFKIIDPDSSWKYNDPFFSLARLAYTFPHDTMEYNRYNIESNDFNKKNKIKPISFKIKQMWKSQIKKNYEIVFKNFFNSFDKKNLFKNKLNNSEFLRFNLSLILCFLRGINANFHSKINFIFDKSNKFQNKSLYLYLFFLIYLNKFTNKLVND